MRRCAPYCTSTADEEMLQPLVVSSLVVFVQVRASCYTDKSGYLADIAMVLRFERKVNATHRMSCRYLSIVLHLDESTTQPKVFCILRFWSSSKTAVSLHERTAAATSVFPYSVFLIRKTPKLFVYLQHRPVALIVSSMVASDLRIPTLEALGRLPVKSNDLGFLFLTQQ